MKRNVRTLFFIVLVAGFGLFACGSEYEWYTTDIITRPNTPGTITDEDRLGNVTAYLIDADKLNQQNVLTGVLGEGKSITDVIGEAKLSSAMVNQGVVLKTGFTREGEGTPGHAYFVLSTNVDGENLLYFSGYSTISPADIGGTGSIVLNAVSSHQGVFRTLTFGDMTAGAGGGWFGVVPEPTSGLLVVFGLVALALRRRRSS